MSDVLATGLTNVISHPTMGYLAAFAAGLLSSFSPCVLAAVPLAVGYVGGYASGERSRTVACSLAFIAGLTAAYTVLGAFAGALGFLWAGPRYQAVLGLVIVVLGLNLCGLIKMPMPTVTPRVARNSGLLGGFVLGAAIATVSAPCATPALVAILAISSASASPWRGALLMAFYAVGHWALVLVAAVASGHIPALLSRLRLSALSSVASKAMGALLVIVGMWLVMGAISRLL